MLLNFIGFSTVTAAAYKVPLKLAPIVSVPKPKGAYDVIVAGTDPEGVMAAVSAARNGLKVLLVEPRPRSALGGLLTLGWLNSLDLNKSPVINAKYPSPYLNQGLFQEWYNLIEGTSFDVNRAASAFQKMVQDEKNIDVLLNVQQLEPIVDGRKVVGMRVVTKEGAPLDIKAGAVIDATQDADIAAAAGAPYTHGRQDIGEPDARMAVTLVFKLSGVTDAVWRELQRYPGTGYDSRSIWGYADAKEYVPSDPERVKIRGLNIGRQDDGTILINSMQIYGIDPLDPASVQEGLRIGRKEAPLIVEYLKAKYPPFKTLKYAGVAPELYVRESRHIIGEYRLTMADLMNNRDQWDAIAYGSYEVDIQTLDPSSWGAIMMMPQQYGVPFRSLVPKVIDNLLVVGRSASFDSLPHGSARVVTLGMATGQAAGAAAKLAKERNLTFRQLSASKPAIAELRKRLTNQGMDLRMRPFAKPEYAMRADYQGLITATSLVLTTGGYRNDAWKLDDPADPSLLLGAIRRLQLMYPFNFNQSVAGLLDTTQKPPAPLTLEQTAYVLTNALGLEVEPGTDLDTLVGRGWLSPNTVYGIMNGDRLTNGELFMLVTDVLSYLGIVYK